ncbi:MAG: 16S rRNA (cytidine(1402)-2'-O)-methyltransferase [Armatimonadota bacterium]|nr:16S rRNA (cytidine(1402)-2'-O)-methyltransferase [Armatimonadota bacterium]
MAGTLYIVATPIGNLEDITLRALRILKEADLIAAEDTRVTRKLLSRYDIHTPLTSYHSHSSTAQTQKIIDALREGKNVALVSDAGTPGISDPGYELIRAAVDAGFRIEAIPGPSAVITALVLSGLPTARFAFDGWVPRKQGERKKYFQSLVHENRTVCLYVAPGRLIDALESVRSELGERQIAVVREATKLFEEVFRGTAQQALEHFSRGEVRGEIVLVISGRSNDKAPETNSFETNAESTLKELLQSGMSERDAVKECAQRTGLPKREIYALALKIKARSEPPPSHQM